MFLASSKAYLPDAGQFWALIRQAWPCPKLSQSVLGWLQCSWQATHFPSQAECASAPFYPQKPPLTLAFHKAAPHQTQRVPLGAPTTPAHLCILFSQLEQLGFAVPRSVLRWCVQLMDLLQFQPTHTFLALTQLFPVLSSLTCHRDVPSMIPGSPEEVTYLWSEGTWIRVFLTGKKCPPTILAEHRGSFSPSLHT